MSTVLVFSTDSQTDLADIVEQAGFSPVVLRDIDDLIMDNRQYKPAIALVDLTIDQDDATATLNALQNYAMTAALPRIAVVHADGHLHAVQNGAQELVTAPVGVIELRTRLRTMIALQQRATAGGKSDSINEQDLMGIMGVLEHDLRSPTSIAFASLDLMSEFLADEESIAPPIFQLVENTVTAIHRQLLLTEDLLDYFRLKAGQFDYLPRHYEVPELIGVATRLGKAQAASNGVQFEVEISNGLPMAHGDANLFRRVVTAGVDCALKFCLKGQKLVVRAYGEANGVVVEIEDNGRGIDLPYRDNTLFELENQSEARSSGSRSSVGMGLPFCKMAVERMGGKIDLSSDDEQNLTILRIWLPA